VVVELLLELCRLTDLAGRLPSTSKIALDGLVETCFSAGAAELLPPACASGHDDRPVLSSHGRKPGAVASEAALLSCRLHGQKSSMSFILSTTGSSETFSFTSALAQPADAAVETDAGAVGAAAQPSRDDPVCAGDAQSAAAEVTRAVRVDGAAAVPVAWVVVAENDVAGGSLVARCTVAAGATAKAAHSSERRPSASQGRKSESFSTGIAEAAPLLGSAVTSRSGVPAAPIQSLGWPPI